MSVRDVRKLTPDYAAQKRAHATMDGWPDWAPKPLAYSGGGYFALVGREHCGGTQTSPLRWHVSLQGPGRTPTWEELVEAAHFLRPGVGFVVSVPPRNLWMNVHPHVLHLWETGDEALIAEWHANARGNTPT